MKDVIYQETINNKVKVGIFVYTGAGDPVYHLDKAIDNYVRYENYNEFIDANMDNPWVRVIIQGLNEMEKVEFKPEILSL